MHGVMKGKGGVHLVSFAEFDGSLVEQPTEGGASGRTRRSADSSTCRITLDHQHTAADLHRLHPLVPAHPTATTPPISFWAVQA